MLEQCLRGAVAQSYREHMQTLLGLQDNSMLITHLPSSVQDEYVGARVDHLCTQWFLTPDERGKIVRLRPNLAVSDVGLALDEDRDWFFRVVRVFALAQAVFGDISKGKRWLFKPKARFGGEAPVALLSTLQGAAQVEEMLLEIAEGYGL